MPRLRLPVKFPKPPDVDPITGDLLEPGEWLSWAVQRIIRRWTFLALLLLVTFYVWVFAAPIWHQGILSVWNLVASALAILIEGAVGIAMFSAQRRDAVVIRELRRTNVQLQQLAELMYEHMLNQER